ncbi:MAG: hypothetical protein IJI22_02595 [Bacilli bacterium]|nr:hypothetical protein [Bacilli bacterium]
MNYEIGKDEVILYEGKVGFKKMGASTNFILTSKKMIFEKEKGLFKKEKEVLDVIELNKIKTYNNALQIKQKMTELEIQTEEQKLSLYFNGMIEAKKVMTKIINATTNTTVAKRGSEKVKGAIDLVDDTLGLDTRGVVRGVVENGIKGTLINGIKKKK